MTTNRLSVSTFLMLFTLFNLNLYSQEKEEIGDKLEEISKHGIVYKLNDEGSSYLKFGMGVQFWYRNMEMNPGTINKGTELPISNHSDFALRRMRMSFMINYEGRHFLYTQFGLTSESNNTNLHSGIFFHDLWYKAKIADKTFIGAGLHMWNGLSRLSNVSYATQITLDNPGVNYPNVNVSDDFVRQYGVFLQGQLAKLEYSFSINQPLLPTNSNKIFNDEEIIAKGDFGIAYNRYHSDFNYKGYVSYSFLEKESVAKTPFKRMTYFGEKGSFLNIGAGFQFSPNASGVLEYDNNEDPNPFVDHHNQIAFSADIWYEKPLPNKSAVNVYTAYYGYNYGPNYLKSGAVMGGFATSDPNAETAAQGPGINQFTIGTGNVGYFSISYVIPNNLLPSKKKLMPFYAVTYKDFEGLNEASFQHDIGAQYLILGNSVKISAQYSTRPVYDASTLKVSDNKGLFILQLQAKF